VDVETRMAPVEDLLHQGKTYELFPKHQGEDLVGEESLDELVVETTDTVKSAIRASGVKRLAGVIREALQRH
jgi:hypothetical protein